MRVAATGGAGTRQHDELPNLLRVLVGERTEDGAAGDGGLVLEANLDDMTPERGPGCWRLFEAGAADVWFTPIHMKKGRPGITLSVLCTPGRTRTCASCCGADLDPGRAGLPVRKWMLERRVITVSLPGGKVRSSWAWTAAGWSTSPPRPLRPPGLGLGPLKDVMARALGRPSSSPGPRPQPTVPAGS